MGGLYHLMIKEAQGGQTFKSLNGRDILNFPLHVPMGIDVLDFLDDTFRKYYLLLAHMQNLHASQFVNIDIDGIKKLGTAILDTLKLFRKGQIADAYISFEQHVIKIYDSLPKWEMKGGEYYRMRKDRNIKRVSQMYPIPPELRYLSGGMRFSIPGYSCLYIGLSKSVCKKEIAEIGSMINIKPKENVEFNLIDLTFSDDMQNGGNEELYFIQSWPLIASCYIDQFYCLRGERVCPPNGVKFNEKYVIPQFLTTFIRKEHKEIDGIKYYTVKDKNLNPFGTGEEDMRNIVIYVDSSSDQLYDDMIRKFDWGEPYNV